MAAVRTYSDPCGIARALDVVGERWALLVVRELLHGPKRFTDLRTGLPGVSADVLSQRLRELEADAVVARAELPPPAAAKVYELTDRGRELVPVIVALGRWGSVAPFPDTHGELSVDAFVVALETLDGGDAPTVQLELPGRTLTFGDGEPIATIAGSTGDLAQVLWHGGPPSALSLSGDRSAARRFLKAFPLP